MNRNETKRTIKGLPPRESVLVQSRHGLGKSQIMQQICQELSVQTGHPHKLEDIRLSQREIGDILGMPRAVDKYTGKNLVWENGVLVEKDVTLTDVTLYNLPAWFPRDPDSYGILFLDEINRATREVQQAAFELVLDYRLNFQSLPAGWRVVAAINEDQDVYSVLNMDPALIDRFMVIDFKPTVQEWAEHAESIGVHDAVTKYITKFPSSLETPESIEPGKVYPSRRSWVKFSNTLKYMAKINDDPLKDLNYLTLLATGYVGSTTAISFTDFVREDYRVLTPDDILNKMTDSLEKELKGKTSMEASYYAKELVKHMSKENSLSKKQAANLIRFYKAIPKDSAAGFWHEFTGECRSIATNLFKTHPEIKKYTLELIGKSRIGG